MPDIDGYGVAVAGRALATKCTGGYQSLPSAAQQWVGLYPWPISSEVAQDILTIARPSNWFGLGRVIIDRQGTLQSGFRQISSQRLFRALDVDDTLSGIVLPHPSRTLEVSTGYPFENLGLPPSSEILYSGAPLTLRGYGPDITRPPWTVLATMTLTVGSVTNALVGTLRWYFLQDFSNIQYVTPVSASLPEGTLRHISVGGPMSGAAVDDTFDFYGRLEESDTGSVLEVGDDGSSVELQTVKLAVRYDARFEVGEYVTISGATYRIQAIEPVGRRKWQNLNLTRILAGA